MKTSLISSKFDSEDNKYHNGLLKKNRNRVHKLFCSNKIRVVVATMAFRMGLDKSDVERVVHCILPESVEEYIHVYSMQIPPHPPIFFSFLDILLCSF
uniref:DNA 3'-5' helicase n=1 Tax=Zea mays TaxID=4577 RepID=B6TJC9_MAIZE|nr:hypothetical protein [Zea mays]